MDLLFLPPKWQKDDLIEYSLETLRMETKPTQVPLEKSQANYEKETQNTFFLAFSVFWKLSSVRELLCYVKQLRFVYIRKYDKVHMGFGLISIT